MILSAYCWISAWVDAALTPPSERERGQGLAEYALILALIAVLAILALVFLGSQIRTILSRVGTSI